MMLRGDHVRSMLFDFALSVLKLYNSSCSDLHSSEFSHSLRQILPNKLSCFDYLLKFPEGVIFRCELLVTYCTFKIFPHCFTLQSNYSELELSVLKKDTLL